MLQDIVFQISKRRVGRTSSVPENEGEVVAATHDYQKWRQRALATEFRRFFDPALVSGKDVLDFGCGTGALSFVVTQLGAKSCIGIDLNQSQIEEARRRVRHEPISFQCATNTVSIDLPDESVDVIACFDVLEHIMEYRAIVPEWHRVLRRDGRILIHWQPWFHPYGHHVHGYIPLPWVHLFLNDGEISEVCARVVDLPNFNPPWWDRDVNGKKINRFRRRINAGRGGDNNFLNKLTMAQFERLCHDVGFCIESRKLSAFDGPALVRHTSSLASKLPFLREFFTANAVYTLSKTA